MRSARLRASVAVCGTASRKTPRSLRSRSTVSAATPGCPASMRAIFCRVRPTRAAMSVWFKPRRCRSASSRAPTSAIVRRRWGPPVDARRRSALPIRLSTRRSLRKISAMDTWHISNWVDTQGRLPRIRVSGRGAARLRLSLPQIRGRSGGRPESPAVDCWKACSVTALDTESLENQDFRRPLALRVIVCPREPCVRTKPSC